MDLWEYTLLDNETYALNSEETITAVKEENWALAKSGYLGIFTEDGKIQGMIPQFIKDVTDDNFVAVTDMTYLFYNCTDLREMPQIPETIENMCNTFSGCANLKESVKMYMLRGGLCNSGSGAGVLSTYVTHGYAYNGDGFRPVVVL